MALATLAIVPLYFASGRPLRVFAGSLAIAGVGAWALVAASSRSRHDARAWAHPKQRAETVGERRADGAHCSDRSSRKGTHALHQRTRDVVDAAAVAAIYARAGAHSVALDGQSRNGARDRLRRGEYHSRSHAAPFSASGRAGRSVTRRPGACGGTSRLPTRMCCSIRRSSCTSTTGASICRCSRLGSYDLVVLEPPPIAYAGVSALYSREFYALARTRLKPNGYISQWLPAYQVPSETALAMVRAFVDVFPQAVLLSGAESDLLLLGANGDRIEIDPDHVASTLSNSAAVRADLDRISLGTLHEIVGSFVGSRRTLADATRDVTPVMDDRPLQEYGVRSMLSIGYGVPGSIVDLQGVSEWCPRCFRDGRPVASLEQLDTYFQLLGVAYDASREEVARARRLSESERRVVAGSAYLGAIVPESPATHNVLGLAQAERGDLEGAIQEFRRALELDPDDAGAHWHIGAALASTGRVRGSHEASCTIGRPRSAEQPGAQRSWTAARVSRTLRRRRRSSRARCCSGSAV